jgi:enoyl-[acyl-carrier protein] reductase I
MLAGNQFLITGIADEHSLAMYAAKEIITQNGSVVCAGLGVTPFHNNLSERAKAFLDATYSTFEEAVTTSLPTSTIYKLDVTLDESIESLAISLKEAGVRLNGFLHAIAMDKTIRQKEVKPLIDVTREEYCETMDVSAYSLIRLTHFLLKHDVLAPGASICSLSYIAAEKVTFHPYRNISIAKAALERITIELADELGKRNGTRVNAIRFSPYMGSKAGNATLNDSDIEISNKLSPLGNARPEDLAYEVAHLFRPNSRITGEIRHVDGGYHIMG